MRRHGIRCANSVTLNSTLSTLNFNGMLIDLSGILWYNVLAVLPRNKIASPGTGCGVVSLPEILFGFIPSGALGEERWVLEYEENRVMENHCIYSDSNIAYVRLQYKSKLTAPSDQDVGS